MNKLTYKKGQLVKIKVGCIWMLGIIDDDSGDDWYEVSYDKKEYSEIGQYRYFADSHVLNIKER